MLNIVEQQAVNVDVNTLRKIAQTAYHLCNIDSSHILTVVFMSSSEIQTFNHTYKHKDSPTDVLTFPSDVEGELGDVLIAVDIAQAQATAYGHSYEREIAFLLVHGFLHAIGYTHDTVEDEKTMTALQETILQRHDLTR
jgi:probable rRNA maturation factor